MATVTAFIRKTSSDALRTYFNARGIVLPDVNWEAPEPDVAQSVLHAVDTMDDLAVARVVNDAERVTGMADEAGQTAIYSVAPDRVLLDALRNAHDRALWLFLNHPDRFRHAEEVRYTEERRRGRMYDGFIGAPNLVLRRDPAAVAVFKQAVRQRFASNNVHVDIFDRTRPMFDAEDAELVQIAIYREGVPDDVLEFDHGVLVLRARRPVFEAALTYEPATGVIEVVAGDRESRQDLVRFLARDLLGIAFQDQRLPLRQYDLSVLRPPFDFPTDPADGIESVRVNLLRLMPIDNDGERVTLECLRRADRTVWDMARGRFGDADPLHEGWVITQAKLTIRFHPAAEPGSRRTLPLTITMPHGCNLKDQTDREQLVGDKYLRRWGIVRDV